MSLTSHHTDGEHPLRSDGYTDRIHRSAKPGSCYVTWSTCVGSGTSHSHQFTAASLNTPQHMHRSPTRLSDLNTSPSFCQRRLQPHLHPAGYGNDRANLRSTAFAKMCNIGSFATATDNIIEASNRGGGPACHQRRIDRGKKTRLTRRVFAYVNAFSLLCDRVRLTRLSPF